ncbi:MAG: hypothetical protein HC869_18315 [Rhodospirillales bacterium]|nr:hypothetical protein [Rhodospirillales bacterium]
MDEALVWVRRVGRVLRHTSIILGVAMISMLWAGIFIKYQQQADTDFRDEGRNGHNLALLFEENALRSIGEVDKALFYLRRNIEARLGTVDFHRLVSSSDILSDLIIQVAVIDAAGIMRASSAGAQPAKPLDLSDREHYRFHLNKTQDELFVSKPVIGRASGKWSVQLTRKFQDKDGSFAGVVVASLDPEHFTKFYKSIDLGPSGSISLVGFDGAVRASGGAGGLGRFKLGQDLSQTSLLEKVRELGRGAFVDRKAGDPTDRLVTFRAIRGHPLAVSVSVTEAQIYAAARTELLRNAVIGAFITCIIFGVSIRGLRDQLSLRRAQRSLLRSRRRALKKSEQLRLTLENMTQGIILVTKDRRVPVINGQVIKLLGLPD